MHIPDNINKTAVMVGLIVGLIVGVIVTIIGTRITYHYYKNKEEKNIAKITPELSIDIDEIRENQLNLNVESLNKNGSKIDKLFFKFDIPGTYLNSHIRDSSRIEKYSISTSFRISINGVTISETIQFELTNIHPGGSFRAHVNYNPIIVLNEQREFEEFYYTPVFDLHDYLPYSFSWTYQGTGRSESGYENLSDLEFIKRDNENLIAHAVYLKSSLNDYLTNHPNGEISKRILKLPPDRNKIDTITIMVHDEKYSKEHIFVLNDTLIRNWIYYTGRFGNIAEVEEWEGKRKDW